MTRPTALQNFQSLPGFGCYAVFSVAGAEHQKKVMPALPGFPFSSSFVPVYSMNLLTSLRRHTYLWHPPPSSTSTKLPSRLSILTDITVIRMCVADWWVYISNLGPSPARWEFSRHFAFSKVGVWTDETLCLKWQKAGKFLSWMWLLSPLVLHGQGCWL